MILDSIFQHQQLAGQVGLPQACTARWLPRDFQHLFAQEQRALGDLIIRSIMGGWMDGVFSFLHNYIGLHFLVDQKGIENQNVQLRLRAGLMWDQILSCTPL